MATLKYWLWLTGRSGMSALRLNQLMGRYGSPEQI